MWQRTKIGNLVDIRRGASPRPIHQYISKSGMPWVKIADATSDTSRYISQTNECIKAEGIKHSVIVNPEDLIISNSATPGLPKIMKIKACIHDGWLVFSNYRGISRDYLYYTFVNIRNRLVNQANGSVFQNLKTDIVKDFEIEVPTLAVQAQIVEVLNKIDEKIEVNVAINNNLQQQVFALYKQMFVDTANDNRHKCRADEFFDISIGKTPPRKEQQWFSDNHTENVVWASISDMGNCGLFIADSSEYLTQEAVGRFNVVVVPDKTVLLSFKLTVGRVAITNGAMTTNEAIAHFKTDNKAINEYLYCYLKLFNYQTMGSTSSIATAVNSKIIKAMPFVVPTDQELANFHSFAAPCFDMVCQNQIENNQLSALRDSILPKLMNGEIDMSDIEI
ncbi:MAG: restriction endonuclease subunit S [Clostridia bacterium]|nr:restriction endonuclease subunit S [Clostridia bacterium]